MSADRLCLGTAQLGFDYGVANRRGRPDDAQCHALLSRALERGIRWWDTARDYGDSEQRIGQFLQEHHESDAVRIVSKCPTPPADVTAQELASWVNAEIEQSLRALRVERLAGWLVHHAVAVERYGNALWDAMRQQVDQQRTDRIGVSVYNPAEAETALALSQINALQMPFNLLDRRVDSAGILDACHSHQVTTFVRSVFMQGVLQLDPQALPVHLSGLREALGCLHDVVADTDWTIRDAALPFVLRDRRVDVVVIGVDDVAQLDDNVDAAERTLPEDVVRRLRDHSVVLSSNWLEPRHWPAVEEGQK